MYKVGIFGSGSRAKNHIDTWKEIPGVAIAGFYAPDHDAAIELATAYGVKRYASEEELIRDCDLADVLYAVSARFGVCAKAIRKGKHVFVEKPMASTMNEAEQLVKLVQESDVKLQVGHMERFNPAFQSLSNLELKPMLIEAHHTLPFTSRDKGEDVVFELMLHDIDIVLSVVKSEVKHIAASGVAVMTDTTDVANARIAFNNGCVANLTASRIAAAPQHDMRLYQKDTYIELDYHHIQAKVFHLDHSAEQLPSPLAMDIPQVPQEDSTRLELEDFVQAVKNNTRTLVNEIDGYRAMEVAHQILQKITPNFSTTT